MSNPKRRTAVAEPSFHVGDQVCFQRGPDLVEGVIVEDRGPLGIGGRRLYGIEYALSTGGPRYIELPAEDFRIAGQQTGLSPTNRYGREPAPPPPAFRVGDRVSLWWEGQTVKGVVMEDLGWKPDDVRRMYRIEVESGPGLIPDLEIPEYELSSAETSN